MADPKPIKTADNKLEADAWIRLHPDGTYRTEALPDGRVAIFEGAASGGPVEETGSIISTGGHRYTSFSIGDQNYLRIDDPDDDKGPQGDILGPIKQRRVGNENLFQLNDGTIIRQKIEPVDPNVFLTAQAAWREITSQGQLGKWIPQWEPGAGYKIVPVAEIPGLSVEDIPGTDEVAITFGGQFVGRASKSEDDSGLPPLSSLETAPIPGTDEIIVRLGDQTFRASKAEGPLPDLDTMQVEPIPGTNDVLVRYGNQTFKSKRADADKAKFTPGERLPLYDVNTNEPLGQLVQLGPNQWQFIETPGPTFDPGPIETGGGAGQGGFTFTRDPQTGRLTNLPAPTSPSELVSRGGFNFIRGTQGQLTPFQPTMQDMIVQALLNRDFDAALAFDDFVNRPTSTEAFSLALQFARSPADQQVVSSLARGTGPVPSPDGVRRIGAQPAFLTRAYTDFLRTREDPLAGASGFAARLQEAQAKLAETKVEEAEMQSAQRLKLFEAQLREREFKLQLLSKDSTGAKTGDGSESGFRKQLEDRSAINEAIITAEIEARTFGWSSEKLGSYVDQLERLGIPREAWAREIHQQVELEKSVFGVSAEEAEERGGLPPVVEPPVTPVVPKPAAVVTSGGFTPEDVSEEEFGGAVASAPSTADFSSALETATQGAADIGLDISGVDLEDFASIDAALAEQSIGRFARGGTTFGRQLEIVGEEGPELVDLAPGSRVIPLGKLSKKKVKSFKERLGARGYQSGGIVFDQLPLDVAQLQAGRAIEPSRGRLLRAAGLTLPSAQAFQNLTPEGRDIFLDLGLQAGIPAGSLAQELATATPAGTRLPLLRLRPRRFAGVR